MPNVPVPWRARPDYSVPLDEARRRLDAAARDYDPGGGVTRCVHTRTGGEISLGANWSVDDLMAVIEQVGVENSGAVAAASGYTLYLVVPPEHRTHARGGMPLFLEAGPAEVTSGQ